MATNWLPNAVLTLAWNWDPSLEVGLPTTAALAAVALIGYLFRQRTELANQAVRIAERQHELERASGIAHQLERIADTLRQDLARHHGRLIHFRQRLSEAQASHDEQAWKDLCSEAEQMLSPTTQLAEQLSSAYDAMRQQSDALETFSQALTDPQTGVGNSHALEEKFDVLLSAARRGGAEFSIALVSIDRDTSDAADEGRPSHKTQFLELARLIQSYMRSSDFIARYSDDEFVVVMPRMKLAGACLIGERCRKGAVERMAISVSCGVAQYQEGDDAKSLLARADSAFYSAKAAGGNRQFVHTGTQLRQYRTNSGPRASEAALLATDLPPNPPLETAALVLAAHSDPAIL
jgi:diguanylate cyclase (GGDEF)-like protein